ncbi:hypothetical protein CAMRE0001_2692 [Campylobacter rectus RM3267]|uniref:Uncharacterized protein n=1 Tax=Campylobacter rectus RM3267 TaxID=553218 RepID=B9D3Z7_CAMRE|nr:hypothetical protein CAMRE0001_2692 [Campylobacter rectus RM3267]
MFYELCLFSHIFCFARSVLRLCFLAACEISSNLFRFS